MIHLYSVGIQWGLHSVTLPSNTYTVEFCFIKSLKSNLGFSFMKPVRIDVHVIKYL